MTTTSVQPCVPLQRLQQVDHGGGRALVEVAGGLVGQQQARLVDHRPGDGDPLALATRQLRRLVPGPVGQAHRGQQLAGPLAALAGRGASEEAASSTFSRALSVSSSPKCWNTNPTVDWR